MKSSDSKRLWWKALRPTQYYQFTRVRRGVCGIGWHYGPANLERFTKDIQTEQSTSIYCGPTCSARLWSTSCSHHHHFFNCTGRSCSWGLVLLRTAQASRGKMYSFLSLDGVFSVSKGLGIDLSRWHQADVSSSEYLWLDGKVSGVLQAVSFYEQFRVCKKTILTLSGDWLIHLGGQEVTIESSKGKIQSKSTGHEYPWEPTQTIKRRFYAVEKTLSSWSLHRFAA